MFKRILIPVDGTERDVDLIHIARHLVGPSVGQSSARIVLVHVEPERVSDDQVFTDTATLEDHVRELRAEGFDAYALIEFDRPESGIATVARYQHSDVIIMAPRHRSGLDTLLHPSVLARLFARSPAPLLIWPPSAPERVSDHPEAHTFLQSSASLVIVPLDGSELAEHALPYAAAIAAEYDRTVALIRVTPRLSWIGTGLETLLLEAEAQQDENRKALRYLKRVRRQLSHDTSLDTSLVVQTVLRVGDPARELACFAEAHPDSLIVMSTHGRGGIGRLVVGSVTTRLVHTTAIPILVVPASRELDVNPAEASGRFPASART